MKKLCCKIGFFVAAVLLAGGICRNSSYASVQGEKISSFVEEPSETVLPESVVWEPEMTIADINLYSEASDYLPTLKTGNYERFVDRVNLPDYAISFYNALIEGSDNDGYHDFLIDPASSSLVETITIKENGVNVNASAVKIATITGVGTNWQEANASVNDYFYQAYYVLRTAFEAFDRDNADVFWLSGSYYVVTPSYEGSSQWNASRNAYDYYYTGGVYLVLKSSIFNINSISYPSAAEIRTKLSSLSQKVYSLINAAQGMTDEAKIRYYNNWLTKNNEYNYRIGRNHENVQVVMKSYPDAFECTAALTGLTGNYGPVCESYARAMKVLCDYSGIPCVLVDGYALNSLTSDGENHMWNYVKLDGGWYAVDVTWNDPLSSISGAVSGSENENYLLVGGDDYVAVGGGTMRFLTSHPVRNKMFSDSNGFANGPLLSAQRYVPTMKSLTLTTSAQSVAYGYTPQPVLTASVVKADGQFAEVNYTWYEVDVQGNENWLYSGNGNVLTFPYNLQPGDHTIRVYASLGRCVKTAELVIKVVRTSFSDVRTNDYYADAVLWAVLNNITVGYKDDLFAPNMNCTRGQVVTFLWRANGCPNPETTVNPFADVKESDYYYKAVLWAAENGITAGYTPTTFAPEDTITRGQCATFLWRAEGCPGYWVENPFEDIEEGTYYYDAVLWAVENGITAGYTENAFAPNIGCTRGQVVCFLQRNQ